MGQHTCGTGPRDRVLGGGFSVEGLRDADYTIDESRPNRNNRWIVSVTNNSNSESVTVTFYAICAQVN